MKLVSWNCRGCFTEDKATAILKHKPDILVIQECQRKWETLEAFKSTERPLLDGRWYGEVQSKSEGVGVFLFSNSYRFECFPECYPGYRPEFKFVLPFKVSRENKEPFTLFAVWAKQDETSMNTYLQQIWGIVNYPLNEQTIIVGDFNSNHEWDFKKSSDSEKPRKKEASHLLLVEELEKKHDILSVYHHFSETKCEQGGEKDPTYFDTKHNQHHIDYCFASKKLMGTISCVKIGDPKEWIESGLSDHCPLIVTFDF